jgi:hypothetical protein
MPTPVSPLPVLNTTSEIPRSARMPLNGDLHSNGLTATGYQKLLTNQQVLHDAVASLDSEGVASRLKASETSASQAAGAAQASAAVAVSAAEITQAAVPVLDALKQIQAQLATVQANLATMQAKLDAVEKKQGEVCCSIM